MVFNNAYSLHDHINNKIDPSLFPEEKHHILQGNIGALVAGNNRLHVTQMEGSSILGIVGDVNKPDTILTSKTGKTENQAGRIMNIPRSFYDDSVPLFSGDSGHGIDWDILNNSENNIGYNFDHDGNRVIGFTDHAVQGTEIGVIPHLPPIELGVRNGKITPL